MYSESTLVSQFNTVAGAVAKNISRTLGETVSYVPKNNLRVPKGVSFQFVARKRKGQFMPSCARVEVTYDEGSDLYNATVRMSRAEESGMSEKVSEGLDVECLANLGL